MFTTHGVVRVLNNTQLGNTQPEHSQVTFLQNRKKVLQPNSKGEG
jgi:hypothetical protein